MQELHLRFRLRERRFDLLEDPIAPRLWHGLRKAFPLARAVNLMPEHGHIATPFHDPEAARQRLARALAGATWSLGSGVWDRVEVPKIIPDAFHLQRQVRYILLNPSRRGLVDDPARWRWSTHRDVLGAVVHPWVEPETLCEALQWDAQGFSQAFHHYVSSDPSVDVRGTPIPTPLVPEPGRIAAFDSVVLAVAEAHRVRAEAVLRTPTFRHQVLALAQELGWRDVTLLAALSGVNPQTIRRARRGLDATVRETLLLILGDERLLHATPPRSKRWDHRLAEIEAAVPFRSPTTKSDFLTGLRQNS